MEQGQLALKNQYDELSALLSNKIPFQTGIKLRNTKTQKRFSFPVVIKENIQELMEFEEAHKKFPKENIKKHQILLEIYEQFNEDVSEVMKIKQYYFQFSAANYIELYQQEKCQGQILKLMELPDYEKLKKYMKVALERQRKSFPSDLQNLQKIIFQIICLQAGKKINIPIRFKNCIHLECYDLSGLLNYCQQNENDKNVLRQFTCKRCLEKYDISSQDLLFENIYIDKDLLKIINQSYPTILQYSYHYESGTYQQNIQQNGVFIDEIIKTFYDQLPDLVKSTYEQTGYLEFQNQILLKFHYCLENPLNIKRNNKEKQDQQGLNRIKQFEYQNYKVEMKDQLTQKIIAYPARCLKCKATQCLDLRTLLCHFVVNDAQVKQGKYQCPGCNQPITNKMYFKQIYFDYNLFSQMSQNLTYYNTFEFRYQGKIYMREEFEKKQIWESDAFIKSLSLNSKDMRYEFVTTQCMFEKARKLEFPLIFYCCETIIDFESFYEKLKQQDFQYDQGLQLCYCGKKIQQIQGNLYFHQALYWILQQMKEERINHDGSFTYDFQINQITCKPGQSTSKNKDLISKSKLKEGFISMKNDEKYQELFKPIHTETGQIIQVLEITETNLNGIHIQRDPEGCSTNVQDVINQLNNQLQTNKIASQYNMEVVQIQQ